ncbi:MAG: TraB/VirB10 family protein [Nitrospirota bacterium]
MTLQERVRALGRKPLVVMGVIAVAILIVVVLIIGPGTPPRPTPSKKPVEVNVLGSADLEKEHWRATAEKDLEAIKIQQRAIEEQLKALAEKGSDRSSRMTPSPTTESVRRDPFEPRIKPAPIQSPPPVATAMPIRPEMAPMPAPFPAPEPIRIFGPESGVGSALTAPPSRPVEAAHATGTGEESAYLPSGSFVQGILLSGLDAPAGVTASKEPHPVLIKLSDLAVLPNRARLDIKDCFIVGEGYGDLSSERAYVRTTTLSCVKANGRSLDTPLKGFVAGEDGKVGLRGRVVSKQGQFLAKALVAGFAEGLSDVFRLSATTVSVSPLGSTQSIDPERALEAGALSGTGRALDRLAQHYINMAERLFPVIEIDAGRKAEVVVLQGRPLESMEAKTR